MHKILVKSLMVGAVSAISLTLGTTSSFAGAQAPVPGYVPPLTMTTTPDYADDTRGVFIPAHDQHRLRTSGELNNYQQLHDSATRRSTGHEPLYAQANINNDVYERELNRISNGHMGYERDLNRIAADEGMIRGGQPQQLPRVYSGSIADQPLYHNVNPQNLMPTQPAMNMTTGAAGGGYQINSNRRGEGVEIAVGTINQRSLDMANSLVKLREERVTVRRALQRMMDQIGGGTWTIVWDLAEENAGLPEMEISLFAEEPFMNVLNALLARVQTRSGQPLRVIRYDNTQRLIITDRTGGHRLAGKTSPVGVGEDTEVAVTEAVLKEAMVSLHYDEIPLVDAMENIVNQAGKGEWRLRVYAGMDQVLKPAHIEEPFAIAIERLLKLFNLKYEIFPGGKLIVITHNNRFGFRGVE